MSKNKKTLIIIGISIAFLLGIYVAFCVIYKNVKYGPYIKSQDRFMVERASNENYKGIVVTAAPSDELFNFGGNLAISQTRLFDESGEVVNDVVDFIIYPEFFGGFKTIVQVQPISGNGYNFEINENMELVDEKYKEIYMEYFDLIKKDFLIAHEVFGIYNVSNLK